MQTHIGFLFSLTQNQDKNLRVLEITKKILENNKQASISWFGNDIMASADTFGFGIFSLTEAPFFSGIMICLDTQCLPVALNNKTQQVCILKTVENLNVIDLLDGQNENVKYLHYYSKDDDYFKMKTGKESEGIFEYINKEIVRGKANDSN